MVVRILNDMEHRVSSGSVVFVEVNDMVVNIIME